MNRLAHFANVYVSLDMTKPEYQVQVDRQLAADLGVSIADIATTAAFAAYRSRGYSIQGW